MSENKNYIGCKFWLYKQCKYYIKFLMVSSMQDICWGKGCFYESEDKIQPKDAADIKQSGVVGCGPQCPKCGGNSLICDC